MQEHKVILIWEAIYDVTDIAEYIEAEFGQDRADRFQLDIDKQLEQLEYVDKLIPDLRCHIADPNGVELAFHAPGTSPYG